MEQESWLESDENYAKWSSQNTTFLDEAYVNQAYTLAPNFNFAECKRKTFLLMKAKNLRKLKTTPVRATAAPAHRFDCFDWALPAEILMKKYS